jgi:DNA-binding NarL/FixJ family response regulator
MPEFESLPAGAAPQGVLGALTARELEVLRLMADGLSTRVIAAKLAISFKTAACHRYRILQKLGVDSTVSAVRWAIRNGIVEP